MDINEIKKYIPHRYPFLLVDRVLEIEAGKRIVGMKCITVNEPFFQGHFPGFPVMPGVLIVESMAQLGAILAFYSVRQSHPPVSPLNKGGIEGGSEDLDKYIPLFTGIDEAKFRKPVVPGDTLRIELNVLKQRGSIWRLSGQAFVDGKLAAEAIIQAILEKKAI
ncbi:MAG: 3-hydroxyacyl-[acyl-carrier-protein] dehydratase FabZ [Nitrospinae bacterium RIFCSPLOWO2_02_FULL_39_110]|nr:MAG: 3-hydroxyacyl-[acyl-carrier-protein] dehydratase FabZ [Nitrospinae bacterium RIFCSPHIGHO2_02_39_11]OGW00146.1 MAG: 3-hydroxyacyl-[acyl-carrier-protein] dehydratase FabZ [Nitrospinae bacterium RIFCSPHIGHO2_12_FULL_39_42]OGW00329.1 MAG: 3-hydroxyacyl-[acyl-carrier-protein] dehydratase FabZ [Nitrospinae bacterium RIFCSPHIGHO2_02_FULL_39_82]OGW02479.1 MAG: 3-hydroxyacyl-[acyl-carrier-protein] dehydratase FabZ [Nitrospinae bacterium RIFCSPLOWO2_02_39_17]OGW07095.1 MAG: 3-hydroxyacyl-[acyl-ca